MVDDQASIELSDNGQLTDLMSNAWVNTSDSQSPLALALAREIIQSTLYCTLATCSADGFPWASPVFFTYDTNLNLYWSSTTAAQHSQNIYLNQGRVAIAIYGTHAGEGKGKGVYLNGTARELAPEQVDTVMQLLFKRSGGEPPQRTRNDYLDASPRRIYCCQPKQVWVTGERLPLGNQLIDTKTQLDLASLIAAMNV